MQRAAGNRHAHRGVVVKMWPSRSWSRRTCSFNSTTLRNTKQVMALMSSEWAAPDSSPGCWPRILVRRLGCQGVDNVLPRDWRPHQQMYSSLLSRVDICLLGSKEPSPIESRFTQSPLNCGDEHAGTLMNSSSPTLIWDSLASMLSLCFSSTKYHCIQF